MIPSTVDASAKPLSLPGQLVFVRFPFSCTRTSAGVSTAPAGGVYHQVLDYEPAREYSLCANIASRWGPAQGNCSTLHLSSYRVVCAGGPVPAHLLSLAPGSPERDRITVVGENVHFAFNKGLRKAVEILPTRWGLLPAVSGYVSLPKERVFGPDHLGITLAPPTRTSVTWVADYAPVPQFTVAGLLGLAAVFAGLGFGGDLGARLSPARWWFWIFLAVAGLGILATPSPPAEYGSVLQQAQSDLDTIKATFKIVDGYVIPLSVDRFEAGRQAVMRARTIPDPANEKWTVLFLLLPTFLFAIVYLPRIMVGWHYLFVRHPAEVPAAPALRSGSLFDNEKLGDALTDNNDIDRPPAAFKSRNLFRRASALHDKIVQDGRIAEAALERDRAKAQAMQAQARLRELRKQLPWWRRWSV